MDHVQTFQALQQGTFVLERLGMQKLEGKGQAVGLFQQGGAGRLPFLHQLDGEGGDAVQEEDAADEHARQLRGKGGGRQAAQQTGKKGAHAYFPGMMGASTGRAGRTNCGRTSVAST